VSPDLHPEELLDKSAAGTLSAAEAQWLEQHLSSCAACRFEQKARADFALAPSTSLNVEDLVSRALAGAPTQQGPFVAPRRRVPVILAASVALFTAASFAAVGQVTGVLPALVERLVAPKPVEVKPAPVEAPRRAVAPEPAPAPDPVPLPEPEVAPIPEPTPVNAVAPAPVVKRAATAVAPVAAAPVAVPTPAAAPELFLRGNAARVRGDRAEAALAYRELLARFPQSDEAALTHAMLGRMLLDGGDAAGALVELDAYLSSADATLREEMMSARALALSTLGRAGDEAQAWQQLLQSYPDSVHASRARARLDALSKP
jgi:hypothetical protein